MNVTTKIETVGKFPDKPWQGRDGDKLWFLDGTFSDGKRFKRTCQKEETAREVHNALTQLVGVEGDFELEETDREYKGQREYKLKSYPGQPKYTPRSGGSGGGYKGSYVPRHRDTAEGTREEAARIARAVALREAVAYFDGHSDKNLEGTLEIAESFFEWLQKGIPIAPSPPPAPTVPANTGVALRKYLDEIDAAVSNRDSNALSNLVLRITASVDKGSVSLDEAAQLNDRLVKAKKAVSSAAELTKWMQAKISEASANEPRHPDAKMNQTMLEAEEVF